MNNKRVLVLTGTTDILRSPTETDNTMQEVFDLTLPSKQRYAKKHGYDLLSLRSFGSDKYNIFKDSNIGFLRVLRAFEMLEYYDIVMWIDADSIITNHNFSINNFEIDENYSFYASWDWNNIGRTFSTGNFIVNKTKNTNNLFNLFLTTGKQVVDNNTWGEEQTTLNFLYNSTHKNDIKILEHKFLGSIPSKNMFRGIWDGRSEPLFPWSEDSFLVHIGGIPNKNRIEVAQTTFKDYL
jgi:hypothetical protein